MKLSKKMKKTILVYTLGAIKTLIIFSLTTALVAVPVMVHVEREFEDDQRTLVEENKDDYLFFLGDKQMRPSDVDLADYKVLIDTKAKIVYLK